LDECELRIAMHGFSFQAVEITLRHRGSG